jgi:SSS family solute:Na+ symporter
MFWKRTTGAAAVAGVVGGFVLSVFFNSYAVDLFGTENILWTAYPNNEGVYEIPFLICMGWAFFFTMLMMVGMSLAGPKINPKGLDLDTSMFKVAPSTLALIVITLLCLAGLYITFW